MAATVTLAEGSGLHNTRPWTEGTT